MAQLVSRQHLLQLLKADGKVEESENSFSYSDFCKWHAECIEDGKRLDFRGELDDGEDKYSFAYDKVKETYLESKCPPIKFAGRGSSRAAFALAGGKCLKIATNSRGIAQNKQELVNSANQQFSCFTKVYAQADDKSSLLVECCCEARGDDFMKQFGIQLFQLMQVVNLAVNYRGLDAAIKHLDDDLSMMLKKNKTNADADLKNEMKNAQALIKLLHGIKQLKAPQATVIADLLQFYENNAWDASQLLTGDLKAISNWGLAARDGQLCLVILDSGFSKSVASSHY